LIKIEKFDPKRIVTAIYLDNEKLQFNVKRFKIETTTLNTKFSFIKEGEGNYLEAVSTDEKPVAVITSGRGAQSRTSKVKVADFVEIMGWKAIGNKLTDYTKSTEIAWQEQEGDKKQAQLF
jgi:topoisomerase-4 subunit A